jgi:hypothetical protein
MLLLGLAVTDAVAGPQIWAPLQTCTTANCGARVINGSYQQDSLNNANPFVIQVFAYANECLRIDVTSQAADLEAVLVSPNGIVYRNDDRTPGIDFRPLLKVTPTPVRGWYTLQISKFNGGQPFADFIFSYGRYNSTNPNCFGFTVPFGADSGMPDQKDSKQDSQAPTQQLPGSGPSH